jgi:hypothetical protein
MVRRIDKYQKFQKSKTYNRFQFEHNHTDLY